MSTMKVTLLGLQQFLKNLDDDLFKNLTLPEGIDKETLTDNIMLRGCDFEVLYADPYFMKDAIGLWSRKWSRTFSKWVYALSIEYAPLENYDRKEDYTDTGNNGTKSNGRKDSGNTTTYNNEDKRTVDLTNVTEREVSAFDSSTYQPAEKTTSDDDGTDTMNHTGTVKDEYGEMYSNQETENTKLTHDGRTHGNIGVTTSQQMLQQELDIAEWNLYEHITDLFLSEFVIPIYS